MLFVENIFYNRFEKKCCKHAIMVVCLSNLQYRIYSHIYT